MFEFIVTRTSDYTGESRPCEEATPKTITVNCYGNEFRKDVWVVNFVGMKDLMNFKKKYGNLIIESYLLDNNLMAIEIYDAYRE